MKKKPNHGPVHQTLSDQHATGIEFQRENLLLLHMGQSLALFSDLNQKMADHCASITAAILELKNK